MDIKVVSAPETPLDPGPIHLETCGTAHRGCDPQCPKRWFEAGLLAQAGIAYRQAREEYEANGGEVD